MVTCTSLYHTYCVEILPSVNNICEPGEDQYIITTQQLVPTGMAAYIIGGNTIHSGLHININQNTLVPLSASVLNTLQVKYVNLKMIFIDEISIVGYSLFKNWNSIYKKLWNLVSIWWFTYCYNRRLLSVGTF